MVLTEAEADSNLEPESRIKPIHILVFVILIVLSPIAVICLYQIVWLFFPVPSM